MARIGAESVAAPALLYADHSQQADGTWTVKVWPVIVDDTGRERGKEEPKTITGMPNLAEAYTEIEEMASYLADYMGHSVATVRMIDGDPTAYVERALAQSDKPDDGPDVPIGGDVDG